MKLDGKKKIIAAARRVVSQSGAAGATIRAIAEEAGMSTGAIYHYYKNKDEVLYDVLDESLSDSKRIAEEIGTTTLDKEQVIQKVYASTRERFGKDTENRLQYHFAHEILLGNTDLQHKFHGKYRDWNQRVEEIMKNLYGLEESRLSHALTSWLLGAVDGVVLQYLLDVNDNDVEDMMKVFELLLNQGLPQFIEILNEQ